MTCLSQKLEHYGSVKLAKLVACETNIIKAMQANNIALLQTSGSEPCAELPDRAAGLSVGKVSRSIQCVNVDRFVRLAPWLIEVP